VCARRQGKKGTLYKRKALIDNNLDKNPVIQLGSPGGTRPLWVRATSLVVLLVYFFSLGSAYGQAPATVQSVWGLSTTGFAERSGLWNSNGNQGGPFADPGATGSAFPLYQDGSSVVGFGNKSIPLQTGDYEVTIWNGINKTYTPKVSFLDFGWVELPPRLGPTSGDDIDTGASRLVLGAAGNGFRGYTCMTGQTPSIREWNGLVEAAIGAPIIRGGTPPPTRSWW
jgi:hypothetical protein